MPTATRDGVTLHYEHEPGEGAPVVFVNDVGAGAWLWSVQAPALAGRHETVVWDLRGTGRSDAPPGPYAVETLAADLAAVLRDAGATGVAGGGSSGGGHSGSGGVHLVGAGLGGMVALAYAADHDDAIASLTLVGTTADGDAVTDRLTTLRASPDDPTALRASLDAALAVDPDAHPDVVDRFADWRADDDADLDAWDAQAAAMRSFDAPPLYEVTAPTLVLHGLQDVVVTPSEGEALAEELPRGEYEPVEGGHWCFLEADRAVTDRLVGWLSRDERD